MHPTVTPLRRALLLAAAALALAAPRAEAQDEELDRRRLKELIAIVDEWAEAAEGEHGDGAMMLV